MANFINFFDGDDEPIYLNMDLVLYFKSPYCGDYHTWFVDVGADFNENYRTYKFETEEDAKDFYNILRGKK